jgi:hypothetical protein
MKLFIYAYIGLLLVLISPLSYTKTKATDGIYHVDINHQYPSLVIKKNIVDPVNLPNFESKNSKVLEIEKGFFFFHFSNTAGFEPHILDKETGEIRLLIDTDGQQEATKLLTDNSITFNSHSFLISSTHIIFRGNGNFSVKSGLKANWYITDGTEAGTRIWNTDIFPFNGFLDIREYSSDEVLVNNGFNLYRFNETTQELTIISDLEGNALRTMTHATGKYSLYFDYLTDGSDNKGKKLSNIKVSSNHFVLYPIAKFDASIYLTHEENNVEYIARISANDGLTNLLDTSKIPQCDNEDTEGVGQVFEDNNYIYFNSNQVYKVGESTRQCIYRYNKSSKEFDVSSNNDFNVLEFTIVAVKNGKPILFVDQNWGDTKYFKYHNFAQVDFDKEVITFAAEKSYGKIQKISINDNYIYAYKHDYSENDVKNQENKLFRLDLSSFESKIIGRRLGVTDKDPSVNHHIFYSFIHDGNLHSFISFPYPTLFKTNEDLTYLKPVSYPAINNQTDKGTLKNIISIDNGWLILYGNSIGIDNGSISHLSLTGEHTTIVSSLKVGPITNTWKNSKNAYLSDGAWLYQIDLATLSKKLIYDSTDNSEYSGVLHINDEYAYLSKHFKSDFLYRLNLNDNTEHEISDYSDGGLYQCGADTYLIERSLDQHSGLHTVNDVYILKDKFQIVEFEGIASTNYRLQLEAITDGKILFVEDDKVTVYDCVTKEMSVAIRNTDLFRTFRDLTWKNSYNQYDKTFYPFYLYSKIFSLSTDTKATEFNIYYDGDIKFTQLYLTKNGVFIYTGSNHAIENQYKLFTIYNKNLIEVDNLDLDTKRYIVNPFKVTQDGRYIIGIYELIKKHFSEKLNKEQLVRVSGEEPYIFDTTLEKPSYLSLFPGIERGTADIGIDLDQRMMASGNLIMFVTLTPENKNELTVIDPVCLLEQQCSDKYINRVPFLSPGATLYYESGDFISIPFRASDSDLDDLNFSLLNAPNWLSINTLGIIEGLIPDKALPSYLDIKVLVSDDKSITESTAFNFYIDDGKIQENNDNTPAKSNEPDKSTSSGSSGGSASYLLFLMIFCQFVKKAYLRNKKLQ